MVINITNESQNNYIYNKFLENFPNFKNQITNVKLVDDSTIRITTKQNKSFLFKYDYTTQDISLSRD